MLLSIFFYFRSPLRAVRIDVIFSQFKAIVHAISCEIVSFERNSSGNGMQFQYTRLILFHWGAQFPLCHCVGSKSTF